MLDWESSPRGLGTKTAGDFQNRYEDVLSKLIPGSVAPVNLNNESTRPRLQMLQGRQSKMPILSRSVGVVAVSRRLKRLKTLNTLLSSSHLVEDSLLSCWFISWLTWMTIRAMDSKPTSELPTSVAVRQQVWLYRPKPIHCNYSVVHYSGFFLEYLRQLLIDLHQINSQA